MAWVSPSNVATGDVLTAATWNQAVVANWQAVGDAWTAYTPTWTNVTLGSATQDCAYRRLGKTVDVRIRLILNGSTISGDPEATLPNDDTMRTYGAVRFPLGLAGMFDSSAGATFMGWVTPSSTTYARVRFAVLNAGVAYGATTALSSSIPFTWANGDELLGYFTYEVA